MTIPVWFHSPPPLFTIHETDLWSIPYSPATSRRDRPDSIDWTIALSLSWVSLRLDAPLLIPRAVWIIDNFPCCSPLASLSVCFRCIPGGYLPDLPLRDAGFSMPSFMWWIIRSSSPCLAYQLAGFPYQLAAALIRARCPPSEVLGGLWYTPALWERTSTGPAVHRDYSALDGVRQGPSSALGSRWTDSIGFRINTRL